MNALQFLLRAKSRLIRALLAVFIANILMASTGFSAPAEWLEHEQSHFSAAHAQTPHGVADAAPDQPVDKVQIKHECHASHFFQTHVASGYLTFPPAPSASLFIAYLTPAPRDTADALFRPPR